MSSKMICFFDGAHLTNPLEIFGILCKLEFRVRKGHNFFKCCIFTQKFSDKNKFKKFYAYFCIENLPHFTRNISSLKCCKIKQLSFSK